ncbi:WecB/TagA/CpsF family glycosyltransferase [Nocardioides sp.]|uniref:WecB/TagA/CpsF family glycosyltransferase n=1 Tax=Nocardioides sp. TaxID=35761 RepID=UPI002606253E|nr:WecB/TagA/CpsF family glycosyltransferase [Nocardioides sp.]
MALVDAVVLLAAAAGAWFLRFGPGEPDTLTGAGHQGHLVAGAVLALLWWGLLGLYGSRDPDAGLSWGAEAGRLARGTFATFGAVGIASVLFVIDVSRVFLFLTFVLGFAALLVVRGLWRLRLRAQRAAGLHQSRVLILGSGRSARRIARAFAQEPGCAYRVTGVHVIDQPQDSPSLLWRTAEADATPIPVLGSTHSLDEALAVSGADTVIVSDSEQVGPDGLTELVWQLAERRITLMVSPNVTGVAQPRLDLREVSGLPFVHVEEPRYADANTWGRALFDRVLAAAMLVVLSPAMLAATLTCRRARRGPALTRSTRVGLGGTTFTMLRFDSPETSWVHRVGLDESPQLLHVLTGSMSLVGPRPLTPAKVAEHHDDAVGRRLLVKPGITGLWQSSGASAERWEDARRLDREYVENWSIGRDLAVLWRTVRALRTRARITAEVARLQARIDEVAPTSKARLWVDDRGAIFLNTYPLFGGDTADLLAQIDALLARREPALVVTVNVDQILDLEREHKTMEVYDGADLLVMDGMPVVQLARMLGADEVHRHTGADLLPLMAEESADRGWRVSILGGASGVAEAAAEQLRETYPGAVVNSVEFPMMRDVADPASLDVVAALADQRPDLVFVCLGAPKQELWMLTWRERLPPAVYVGAGAAVDFAAQKVSRAPVWLQRVGGEWLWRLAQEPRRLAGRYLLKGPRFLRVMARSLRSGSGGGGAGGRGRGTS